MYYRCVWLDILTDGVGTMEKTFIRVIALMVFCVVSEQLIKIES